MIVVTDLGLRDRLTSGERRQYALSIDVGFRGVLHGRWSSDRPKDIQANLPGLFLPAILPKPAKWPSPIRGQTMLESRPNH